MNRATVRDLAPGRDSYLREVDFIKAIAIIAVLCLHSLPVPVLLSILAPFHIWQAVPLFIMMAGFTANLTAGRRSDRSLANFYSKTWFKRLGRRFLIPFIAIWLLEIVILGLSGKAVLGRVAGSLWRGGFGPGSYFIPLFFQHLLIFPLLLRFQERFVNRPVQLLVGFLLLALGLDWGCRIMGIPEGLYRLLYVRYIFAAVLGGFIAGHRLGGKIVLPAVGLGALYIGLVSYRSLDLFFIYPAWSFQHAPAYFYTAGHFLFLWRSSSCCRFLDRLLLPLGRASFHIFLFQMVWFWKVSRHIEAVVGGPGIALLVNLLVCLGVGWLFYRLQWVSRPEP